MNKKALVILLLALLACGLFAVTLGLGAGVQGGGMRIELNGAGAERISRWISRPAEASRLTPQPASDPACQLENGRISLQPGATCIYHLAADKVWTLKLRLVIPTAQVTAAENETAFNVGSFTVWLEQPAALQVEQTMLPGSPAAPLDIYGREDRAAATLRIRAPGGPAPGPGGYVIEIVER